MILKIIYEIIDPPLEPAGHEATQIEEYGYLFFIQMIGKQVWMLAWILTLSALWQIVAFSFIPFPTEDYLLFL